MNIPATRPSEDLPALEFPAGIPGFGELRQFALAHWGGPDSPYSQLLSLEEPDVKFLVSPPDAFYDNYAVELEDEQAAMLDLTDPADALVLVVVNLTEPIENTTANLLGPLIVNTRTRKAAQIVLEDSQYDASYSLVHK